MIHQATKVIYRRSRDREDFGIRLKGERRTRWGFEQLPIYIENPRMRKGVLHGRLNFLILEEFINDEPFKNGDVLQINMDLAGFKGYRLRIYQTARGSFNWFAFHAIYGKESTVNFEDTLKKYREIEEWKAWPISDEEAKEEYDKQWKRCASKPGHHEIGGAE